MPASIETDGGAPRVAFLTPCYNDGATLPETVASARAFAPAEIVVVDDGSDDPRTLAVLEEVAAGGVRVLRQKNAGPSAARDAALRATTAPYVFPLDADDLVIGEGLADLVAALDRSPDAALAWGDIQFFGDSRRLQRCAASLDPWLVTHLNPLPYASLLRRDALLAIGGWGPVSGFEDWDLWMSFAERGWSGLHVARPVLRYRIHANRRWRGNVRRHGEIYGELERRHPSLFAARAANWRRSSAPLTLRMLLPLIAALPVPSRTKVRLRSLVANPLQLAAHAVRRATLRRTA
jgi:glycosyltransferase involved in cell wall biosynthesis